MTDVGEYNTTIVQGETWDRTLTFTDDTGDPIDYSGYSVKMQIRKDYGAYVITEIEDGSGIDMTDADTGVIALQIGADITSDFNFNVAKYDIRFTSGGGDVSYKLEGILTLNRSITT